MLSRRIKRKVFDVERLNEENDQPIKITIKIGGDGCNNKSNNCSVITESYPSHAVEIVNSRRTSPAIEDASHHSNNALSASLGSKKANSNVINEETSSIIKDRNNFIEQSNGGASPKYEVIGLEFVESPLDFSVMEIQFLRDLVLFLSRGNDKWASVLSYHFSSYMADKENYMKSQTFNEIHSLLKVNPVKIIESVFQFIDLTLKYKPGLWRRSKTSGQKDVLTSIHLFHSILGFITELIFNNGNFLEDRNCCKVVWKKLLNNLDSSNEECFQGIIKFLVYEVTKGRGKDMLGLTLMRIIFSEKGYNIPLIKHNAALFVNLMYYCVCEVNLVEMKYAMKSYYSIERNCIRFCLDFIESSYKKQQPTIEKCGKRWTNEFKNQFEWKIEKLKTILPPLTDNQLAEKNELINRNIKAIF